MTTNLRNTMLFLGTCLLLLLDGTAARAADAVLVIQIDGRVARGDRIGDESNGRTLVIETVHRNVAVKRTVPWSQVVAVRIGDTTFRRDSLVGPVPHSGESPVGADGEKNAPTPVKTTLRVDSVLLTAADRGIQPDEDVSGPRPVEPRLPVAPPPYEEERPGAPPPGDVVGKRVGNCPCRFPIGIPIRRARVLGVREDPLSAYDELAARYFPNGIPLSEIPFALDLLRAKKADDVFGTHRDAADGAAPEGAPGPATNPPAPTDPFTPAIRRHRSIRGIAVSAVPISAHGKADADALAVDVRGYDEYGQPALLQGTLTAVLHGQSQRLVRAFGRQYIGEPGRVERLATWTRSLGGDQPGLVLSLPRPLPDHDPRRAPLGEISVRLLVPGQGVFEASSPVVLVRTIGPLRDQNLLDAGTRFFTGELTHDGRQPTGFRVVNPSAIRPNGRVLTVQP